MTIEPGQHIASMVVSSIADAFDLQLMGMALSNAQAGLDAYMKSRDQALRQAISESEAQRQMMDLAVRQNEFRRVQQLRAEAIQISEPPVKISCEADCKSMYDADELKFGETTESCIASLCGP